MAQLSQHNILNKIREKSGIDTLDTREKFILGGGLLFVVSFLVFQLVIVPFWEARNNLEKSIGRKKLELIKIRELQSEYLSLKSEEGTIQARIYERDAGFTLFTFLDQQAEKSQVKKQIKYMKPSSVEGAEALNEAMVEMKLQKVTLEALVEFLKLIESEKNVVFVRRISIQESGDGQGYLDVILQIVTFEEKE